MGKNTEITWLQRVRKENKYGERERDPDCDALRQKLVNISGALFGSRHAIGDWVDSGFLWPVIRVLFESASASPLNWGVEGLTQDHM